MPTGYKLITAILALTGSVSLVISGEINPLMSIGGLAAFPGYYRFLKGHQHAPSWAVGIFSVLTLFVFGFESIVSGDIFLAVAHLTISFQAIKSFDLKEPWDHVQVYFMSLLQLIIASEMTYSVVFGVVFIVFMGLLVTAMVYSHFLKEKKSEWISIKKPAYIISALTLLTTSLVFISIPRTSYKFLGKSHTRAIKTTGFSGSVDFGSFGTVKLDPTVTMRIEMDINNPGPFYWRGIALDFFDGRVWTSTDDARYPVRKNNDEFSWSNYDRSLAIEQKIYLEPIDSDIVFGLPEIQGIRSEGFAVYSDAARSIYFNRKASRRIQYTVYSLPHEDSPGTRQSRYLQIPPASDRIIGLAYTIAPGGMTDIQKAESIEQYLRKNYRYSLTTENPGGNVSPLEDFIFISKTGYCEHYASAMALMLRAIGVPSRIVTGFYGGEKNLYGGYLIVRQSDAHTWVEALIDGRWRRFDPTPIVPVKERSAAELVLDTIRMSWTRYVVGFSSSDQRNILQSLYGFFTFPAIQGFHLNFLKNTVYALPLVVAAFCLAVISLRYKRQKKCSFVTVQYMTLRKILKKKGIGTETSTTSGLIRKQTKMSGASHQIDAFLSLYESHRFGNKDMDHVTKKRFLSLLKEIRKVI